MIYLDSAAIVKLAHAEPESSALRAWLGERADTGWISSVLTEVESFRALATYAPQTVARLPAVLDRIELISLDASVRALARTVRPPAVLSLDAIHLGTALHARSTLTSFVTYDKRLLDAALAAGLPAGAPTTPQRLSAPTRCLACLWAMTEALTPARDLTDSGQNQAVLDAATALIEDDTAAERIAIDHGPAVAAEAMAVARSRQRLGKLTGPIHLTVVWAMYGETGRMVPRSVHPHGEDFVRAKVRQLDWLTGGLPGVTWSIIAVDDGCPDQPSSAALMAEIAAAEGYPEQGHRSVTVLRLADIIAGDLSISPAFDQLTSADQSRKGGSILAGLAAAVRTGPPGGNGAGRHIVAYTDADLSANLAQLGSLAAPVVAGDAVTGALGQRYGLAGAVLIRPDGPVTEPHSTGDKPDKIIVLFRHFVRATLIPSLAPVLDTQAGFKAFDGAALGPVLGQMVSFNETFDVELLIHLAQRYGPETLAVEPIVFTEDFAATKFPSVDPGPRHLAMVHQIVDVYDRFVAPADPVSGEAADLLALVRTLCLDGYVTLIEQLRAEDRGDPTLFDRRWPVSHLREILAR